MPPHTQHRRSFVRGSDPARGQPSVENCALAGVSLRDVDFNGVHALSGFLLFLPAYYFALKPRWAILYAIYVAAALIVSGLWAFWSTSPAGIFAFPNNNADAVFHISTGILFALVATIQLELDRRRAVAR